jgi:hypothetical protein
MGASVKPPRSTSSAAEHVLSPHAQTACGDAKPKHCFTAGARRPRERLRRRTCIPPVFSGGTTVSAGADRVSNLARAPAIVGSACDEPLFFTCILMHTNCSGRGRRGIGRFVAARRRSDRLRQHTCYLPVFSGSSTVSANSGDVVLTPSLSGSFRGAAQRRARNPVIAGRGYWVPGSPRCARSPGMTVDGSDPSVRAARPPNRLVGTPCAEHRCLLPALRALCQTAAPRIPSGGP